MNSTDAEHPGFARVIEEHAALRRMVVDGELWSAVMAGSARDMPFPRGAEQRLAGFAELVAQALANAEAREELTASRKRLVEAAQLERRRLVARQAWLPET